MSTFLQFHVLTMYPPSNPNRDDMGRPKTCIVGDSQRMRHSSQSIKRAWRESDVFQNELGSSNGERTRIFGEIVCKSLIEKGISQKDAVEFAKEIAKQFGRLASPKKEEVKANPLLATHISQLAHISPEEKNAVLNLIERIAKGEKPTEKDYALLRHENTASDIALFGRMLADAQEFNKEAAAQVAHAFTIHAVDIESDYFSAVDDLNKRGAGHIGEREFGSGVFYLYVCVDVDLLVKNLNGHQDLAQKTLRGLAKAIATVAPSGMNKSYASNPYASYILAERGTQQPRSLALAFLNPIKAKNEDILAKGVKVLEETREAINTAYGATFDADKKMHVGKSGTLDDIVAFAEESVHFTKTK